MEKQHYKMYKDGKKWVFAAVTVIALGVGLSESTYVVKADSTVTIASTDDSVNTGSASKNPTVPVTSTDNSKKIKSSLVINHLEEKGNLEKLALSSDSVQPATSISDDTYLKNLGIDINDLNTNSV